MNTRIITTLFKKEMLDVLRDKKTVIMMLVVPVILYPLIFIVVMQVMAAISSSMEEQNYKIAIEAEDDGAFLQRLMEKAEKSRYESGVNKEKSQNSADTFADHDEDDDASETAYTIIMVDPESIGDYERALEEEELDVYVRGTMEDGKLQYDVYYISSVTNSNYAMNIVMDVFDEY